MPGAEAAASVIPAFVGMASTVMQSNANREAIREQNEYDYKKWREYIQEIDPSTQVMKMRRAGINPAIALSQGAIDSGNPSSAPPQSHVPQYDFSPMAQGFRDSVELYQNQSLRNSQIENLNSQTENNRIRNRTQLQRDLMDLTKQYSDVDKNSKEAKLLWTNMKLVEKQIEAFDEQNSADLDLKHSQANQNKAHADYLRAQEDYQNILIRFTPKQQLLITRNLEKQSEAILAAARRDNEQAALAAAQKAVEEAKKEGLDISNDQADAIVDAKVDEAYSEATEAYWKSQQAAKHYLYGVADKLPGKINDDGFAELSRPPARRYASHRYRNKHRKDKH